MRCFRGWPMARARPLRAQRGHAASPGPRPRSRARAARCLDRRYTAALEQQIRDFPDDPSTDEARWLLGKVAVDKLDRERAEKLWSAIAPVAALARIAPGGRRASIATQLLQEQISPDRKRMAEIFDRARRFLLESIKHASSEPARTELLLERARLDLMPFVGAPEAARDLCEQFARLPSSRSISTGPADSPGRAGRDGPLHRSRTGSAEPSFLAGPFRAERLLRCRAPSRRMRLDRRNRPAPAAVRPGAQADLIEPVLKGEEQMPPENRSELAFRETRALLFTGADREARLSVAGLERPRCPEPSDRLLRELGDTYSRLEIYSHDIDVQRLRMKNNAPGSLPWFDARYALALAYFHTGKLREAAQLIDSTAILRPELGGTVLHDKFIRLRQRLGVKP